MSEPIKCASCGAAATRRLPVVVQLSIGKASPIHIAGRSDQQALSTRLDVPICDDCAPLSSSAHMLQPEPLPDAPRVKAATADTVGRLVKPCAK